MDRTIINNWNRVVAPEDTVWHLGDYALSSKHRMLQTAKQLNGHVKIFIGNHDKPNKLKECGFEVVESPILIKDNFIISHTPTYIDGVPCLNVGVDVWNFTPIPFPTTTQQINLCGHVHENWVWFIALKK